MPEENDLVVVYAGNSIEAGILKGLLEDDGIKVFLKDEFMGSIFPGYVTGGGGGAVKVIIAKSDLDRAKPIVQTFSGENPTG